MIYNFFLNAWLFFLFSSALLFLSFFVFPITSSFVATTSSSSPYRFLFQFLASSPPPPLPRITLISFTSSRHHHVLLFLHSSMFTLIPSIFLCTFFYLLSIVLSSHLHFTSIFSSTLSSSLLLFKSSSKYVCLFCLSFFSFHVTNFKKRGCMFIIFVCLFVSGAISARIFYGLSLRWNIKIGLME